LVEEIAAAGAEDVTARVLSKAEALAKAVHGARIAQSAASETA
jgi:hypothetical protein